MAVAGHIVHSILFWAPDAGLVSFWLTSRLLGKRGYSAQPSGKPRIALAAFVAECAAGWMRQNDSGHEARKNLWFPVMKGPQLICEPDQSKSYFYLERAGDP